MKKCLPVLLLLFACVAEIVAADAPSLETVTLRADGELRQYALAGDEVWVQTGGEPGRIRQIVPQKDRAGLDRSMAGIQSVDDVVFPVLYLAGQPRSEATRRILTGRMVLHVETPDQLASLLKRHGLTLIAQPDYAPGMAIVASQSPLLALDDAAALDAEPDLPAVELLLKRTRFKRRIPNDTLFPQQWHLRNTTGPDVNITNVWDTYRGSGIRIGIVDDGLQITHPDLAPNVDTVNDWDWNGNDGDPSPNLSVDDHGTSCAGVAAARGGNNLGVAGAAYEATLVGLRLIAAAVDDQDEAEAVAHRNDIIQLKSNSWGPNDDGQSLEGPASLARAALAQAGTTGRGGLGTILVWAGGNGLDANDNANYDGYANSIYTIAVAAIDRDGNQSWYSEPGACLVVTAPSSGDTVGITTTDLTGSSGYDASDYTADFGGTSSATPLVAGIAALMLEANPQLGWRDVQEILIRSAFDQNPTDPDWSVNGAGLSFNHKFGAGRIDAAAAVALATTWVNLPAQTSVALARNAINRAIPDNNASGITETFDFSSSSLRVEHVTVTFDASHAYRGDIEVTLTSPSGMQSRLAEAHGDGNADYNNWTFSSVRHWGELSVGTWSVNVADRAATDTGTLRNLEVRLYGTETDVSNRPPVIATSASQYTVSVTNLLTFAVSASEPDGDMITLSATNLPSGAFFAETQSTGLVQSTFSWTPATNAAGTYAVAFRASDKDGATERTVTIRVGSGGSLDIGGYTLLQYNSSQSFAMPAPLELESGQYLVIARDAEQSAFETYWGVTLGSDVIFLNSGGVLPQINGDEVFELRDAANATLEGPTGLAISSGQAVQRTTLSDNAASAGSWAAGASSTATPGAGAPAGAQAGLAITEYADALGTGNFVYEFVELYLDGGGGGSPSGTPPLLAAISNQNVTVGGTLAFAVAATPTEADPVALTTSNAPLGSTFSSVGASGTFTWPDAGPAGSYSVTFIATDKDGSATRAVTINVTTGAPPGGLLLDEDFDNATTVPAGWIDNGTVNDLLSSHYQSASNCRALGTGDTLVTPPVDKPCLLRFYVDSSSGGNGQNASVDYSIGAGPWIALGTFAVSTAGATQTFSLQSEPDLTTADQVRFRFNSSFNTWYLDDVQVEGCAAPPPVSGPPVLSGLAGQTVVVGTTLEFLVRADDADGDLITLTSTNLPNHAVFAATTGVSTVTAPFSFTPALNQTGTVAVTFLASASDGTATGTVSITVIPEAVSTITNLVYFDFETSGGVFEVSPETVAGHLLASDFGIYNDNPQFFKGNPGQALAGTGWDAADESRYFSMSVTVDSGYAMHITSVSFDDRASGTGPVDWTVVSSRDAFNTAWGTGATHVDSFGPNLIEHMESDVTGTLEIRIAGANASSASGTWRIDNVRLMGYVVPTGAAWIDADGDGMPDEWEFQFSGSITGLVAHADDDADGASNSEEFISGTDPFDEHSVLRIGDVTGMQQGLIAFPGRQGRRYQLQVATNLMEALPWRDAAGPVSGSNTLMQLQDPVATGQRYYRIRVEIE